MEARNGNGINDIVNGEMLGFGATSSGLRTIESLRVENRDGFGKNGRFWICVKRVGLELKGRVKRSI